MQQTKVPVLKIVVALVLIAALVIVFRVLPVQQWLMQFQGYVKGLGALGYVLYALAYAVCCVLLIPALVLTLGAGAIFGFVAGSIVVLVGATIGATIAFILARTVLRHRVEAMLEAKPKLAAIDRAVAREGTKIMLLCRLSGFPPFTWVNYAFGLTGVGLTPYVLTTLFGIIPGTLAFTYAGAAGVAALTGQGNRWALIATAAGVVLVSAYVGHIATQAIRRAGVEQE